MKNTLLINVVKHFKLRNRIINHDHLISLMMILTLFISGIAGLFLPPKVYAIDCSSVPFVGNVCKQCITTYTDVLNGSALDQKCQAEITKAGQCVKDSTDSGLDANFSIDLCVNSQVASLTIVADCRGTGISDASCAGAADSYGLCIASQFAAGKLPNSPPVTCPSPDAYVQGIQSGKLCLNGSAPTPTCTTAVTCSDGKAPPCTTTGSGGGGNGGTGGTTGTGKYVQYDPTANCPTARNAECVTCITKGGSWTGVGCLNTSSTSGIVVTVIRIAVGIMGGVFLLLMISAGYLYQTGQTENIEKAKQRITAMLGALIFLVFSVLLLRIIGINILDVTTLGVLG